ncbi:MAG: hypothetical protein CBC48_18330 [bacterium TMED88]|nr:hypothetical protein [Deltaproteobacteria bacterium]OUV23748.1 MAG: hypothetical protein CBC48_18330 [bacterium TMED88]
MERVELIAVYLHQAASGPRRRFTVDSSADATAGTEAIWVWMIATVHIFRSQNDAIVSLKRKARARRVGPGDSP